MRKHLQANVQISAAERFKAIYAEKMEEHKNKAMMNVNPSRKMSKQAEQMLKQISQKKARKKAKELRQRVIVQPRNYSTGYITKKGKIGDIAGNSVAQVNLKNGKIKVTAGMGGVIGRYKPNNQQVNLLIQDAITKYSPYYINLRKMQEMQSGNYGVWGDTSNDSINIHGRSSSAVMQHETHTHGSENGVYGDYGSDQAGPRQNVGTTAWGAMSDNVWGTYTDNIWGTSTDTVWGTNTSDIWGGIGGNPWGNLAKTHRIWGSGNGHNHLARLAAKVAAFFGLNLKTQASRAAFHESVNAVRNSRSGAHEHGPTTRASAGAHEHGPTTRAAAADHAPATRAPAAPAGRR